MTSQGAIRGAATGLLEGQPFTGAALGAGVGAAEGVSSDIEEHARGKKAGHNADALFSYADAIRDGLDVYNYLS